MIANESNSPSASSIVEPKHYLVRYGVQGTVERFRSGDGTPYRRGQRAICQIEFGLIVGEVLSAVSPSEATAAILLRPMTGQDELLHERLTRYKEQAIHECRQALAAMNCSVELLDVDHLFDGRTLIFYFLGELSPSLQEIPDQLAKRYEKRVRTREFARLLEEGCGPGCGREKSGCSTGGCAVCLVAGGCSSKHKRALP